MKKKIIAFILLSILLFALCSCKEKEYEKTYTSVSTTFTIEGIEEARYVTITAKEKKTKEKIKITVVPEKEKILEIEPGTYIISKVSSDDKQISVSINEQYFVVDKGHRIIPFTVKEENKVGDLEWFFMNNGMYIFALVASCVVLGVVKIKKDKQMREK